jgi:hypothetical protein
MYTDIMSAVNNDALVNVWGAGLFAVLAWIYRRGPNVLNAPLALLLVIAALLTKSTAVTLVPTLALGVICYLWRSRKAGLIIATVSLLSCALLATGIVVWQRQAPQQFNQAVTWVGSYFRIDVSGTLENLINPARLIDYQRSASTVFNSFWAAFGWRHILLTPGWYVLLAVASLASLVGLVWLGFSRTSRVGQAGITVGIRCLLFSAISLALAWSIAVIRGQADQGLGFNYFSHGRYVFVAMVPFTLLFTYGCLGAIPERLRRFGVITYLLCVVAFDAICFWAFLMPYYTCCRAI